MIIQHKIKHVLPLSFCVVLQLAPDVLYWTWCVVQPHRYIRLHYKCIIWYYKTPAKWLQMLPPKKLHPVLSLHAPLYVVKTKMAKLLLKTRTMHATQSDNGTHCLCVSEWERQGGGCKFYTCTMLQKLLCTLLSQEVSR